MPKILPWDDPQYALCESANNGTVRFLKPGSLQGPWRLVPGDTKAAILERERRRQAVQNDHVGSLTGNAVVVCGAGPMVERVTKQQVEYLIDQGVVFVGVNALPGIAKRIWGIEPDRVFRYIVAADVMGVHRWNWKPWGWHYLDKTMIFNKGPHWDELHMPMVESSCPSLCLPHVYWRDSITATINLTIMAMGQRSTPRDCAGPRCDWPQVQAKPGNGQIVLLGVEHNQYDHVYTGDERFDITREDGSIVEDFPNVHWPDMHYKHEGHKVLAGFAREMGIRIFSAAPWSEVKQHTFIDFEDYFDIPKDLRTGVTAEGRPAPKQKEVAV